RGMALRPPPIARTAIELPADTLARYVGEYQFNQDFTRTGTLSVTVGLGVLMMQITGGDKAPICSSRNQRPCSSLERQTPGSPFSPILTASRPGSSCITRGSIGR